MASRAPQAQWQMLGYLEPHSFSGAQQPALPPVEEAGRRGTLGRPRHGRRGQEEGMWPWASRQAGFSGEDLDPSLGVAAPDYLEWATQDVTPSP